MTGVAFELRDSQYSAPNRSLVSNAVGRTKDYKDRRVVCRAARRACAVPPPLRVQSRGFD